MRRLVFDGENGFSSPALAKAQGNIRLLHEGNWKRDYTRVLVKCASKLLVASKFVASGHVDGHSTGMLTWTTQAQ